MQPYPTTRCSQLEEPAAEPVTLAEAKAHIRVDNDDSNTLITALIVAARQFVESFSGRTLAQRSYTQTMEYFPDSGKDIVLRRSPVKSVTSVKYFDSTGADITMVVGTDYRVDTTVIPARIRLPVASNTTGALWVRGFAADDCVRIVYLAGADNVPTAAKQTILLLVGHWFENRESVTVGATSKVVDQTVNALMDSYRIADVAL